MKRRNCISSSTSAAIEDMREFMKYQLELFKVETEKMLERTIEQVKEMAAEDSSRKRKRMRKTDQKSTESEPHHMTDSPLRNSSIQPLNDHVRAGSGLMDAAADSVSSETESENAAGLEDPSRVNILRKSGRMIKKPQWMKDFITIEELQSYFPSNALPGYLDDQVPRKYSPIRHVASSQETECQTDAENGDLMTTLFFGPPPNHNQRKKKTPEKETETPYGTSDSQIDW